MPHARIGILAGLCLALTGLPIDADAQSARTITVLPELRAELTSGDVASALIGGGMHVRSGTYFRLAALVAAGPAWAGGEQGTASRLELHGRFHLDPFREARFGAYGVGGVALTHDPFTDWQARLVVGAGMELPARGRTTLAVEAALAGGLRLSLVVRRSVPDRR